jgi:hypothetical protein
VAVRIISFAMLDDLLDALALLQLAKPAIRVSKTLGHTEVWAKQFSLPSQQFICDGQVLLSEP